MSMTNPCSPWRRKPRMKRIEPEFEHLHPQTKHTAQALFERETQPTKTRAEIVAACIARAKAHSKKHYGIEE